MSIKTLNANQSELVANEEIVSDTNALPVKIVSGGGGGGGGSGTEYVEDAVAPANPTGGIVMAVRKDTLSASEVSADGDVIALKSTNKGQLHVLAEVTGGPTAANQATLIGHVDGLEAAVAATNTKLDSVIASLTTIDGRVDGLETLIGATNTQLVAANAHLTDIEAVAEDITTPLPVYSFSSEYEAVAASVTDQILGATGAIGDKLEGILVIPTSTSPGAVAIEDGAVNTIVFEGGANSVVSLHPFFIPLMNITSISSGWKITTGVNVRVIGFGNFT